MSEARDERAPNGRPRLGELLVAAGLVTPETIEQALAAQQVSGLPIGRILVEAGHVTGSQVAMALADQHGGPLRTEYGFATGHLAQLHEQLPPLRVVALDPVAPAPERAAPAPPATEPTRVQELEAALQEAAETIAELRQALAAAQEATVPERATVLAPVPAELVEVDGVRYAVARLAPEPAQAERAVAAFLDAG